MTTNSRFLLVCLVCGNFVGLMMVSVLAYRLFVAKK